jgi:hypothetical protein
LSSLEERTKIQRSPRENGAFCGGKDQNPNGFKKKWFIPHRNRPKSRDLMKIGLKSNVQKSVMERNRRFVAIRKFKPLISLRHFKHF